MKLLSKDVIEKNVFTKMKAPKFNDLFSFIKQI